MALFDYFYVDWYRWINPFWSRLGAVQPTPEDWMQFAYNHPNKTKAVKTRIAMGLPP